MMTYRNAEGQSAYLGRGEERAPYSGSESPWVVVTNHGGTGNGFPNVSEAIDWLYSHGYRRVYGT